MNMAVCPEASGLVPFYVVSDRFAEDHPEAPHWAKYQLSSLNRNHILNHREVISGLCNECLESQEAFEAYVEEIQVPCKVPGDLLYAASVRQEDVDLLEVDAEGEDAKIVSAFLSLPRFRPALIVFEEVHLSKKAKDDVYRLLAEKGYTARRVSMNTIAQKLK